MASNTNERGNVSTQLQSAVTIWNDSGGVGKTTVAINVAEALARQGDDVLVIDLDPQYAGLTDHAGYDAALKHPQYNLVEVLMMPNRSLEEIVIQSKETDGLSWDLIPAHEDLESFGQKMANNLPPDENVMVQLRRNIEKAGIHTEYDYILIDCQATKGKLVANAVAATLNVMIPTELSRKGVRSVDGLANFVTTIQRDLRHVDSLPDTLKTAVISVVPNEAAKNGRLTNNEKDSLQYLLDEYPTNMPNFYIPSREALKQSWTAQKPLLEFIESNENRSFRDNEEMLPEMFECLAEMIYKGSAGVVDDSHVANIPGSCYPEHVEEPNNASAMPGDD